MADEDRVICPVDQICACPAHIAGMIGDEVHERRAEVGSGRQQLSDDPQMAQASRCAKNQREILASRRLLALQNEVGNDRKRKPSLDVGKRIRPEPEGRKNRLRLNIHLAQEAWDLDQRPRALQRRRRTAASRRRRGVRSEASSPGHAFRERADTNMDVSQNVKTYAQPTG